MRFLSPLLPGRLLKRYKRFLADVELPDGAVVTAHTANTGAMTGCAEPGSRVWLSQHDNPKRKYRYSWELVEVNAGKARVLAGINTMLSNKLVQEAVATGRIDALSAYTEIRREVPYGREGSRIDLFLRGGGEADCYIEVKNVTLVEDGVAMFPDAVSHRASKHLRELAHMVESGNRAIVFYCIQRGDVNRVRAAAHIDPEYARTLVEAKHTGVEVIAYKAQVSTAGIELIENVAVE